MKTTGPWCRVGEAFRCGESNANVYATGGRLDKSTRRKVADHVEGQGSHMPIAVGSIVGSRQGYRRSSNMTLYHCSFEMTQELQSRSIERSKTKKSRSDFHLENLQH